MWLQVLKEIAPCQVAIRTFYVQVGACHVPARNGPMATAGRLLLPPTPPKAPRCHMVCQGHTHTALGLYKGQKEGEMAKKKAQNGPISTYPACAQADPGTPDSNAPNEKSIGS